jgi:hypothetical protein
MAKNFLNFQVMILPRNGGRREKPTMKSLIGLQRSNLRKIKRYGQEMMI